MTRRLDPSHQHQDHDDDQEETHAATGSVAPVRAVGPSRQRADQQQNQNNDQDRRQHRTLLSTSPRHSMRFANQSSRRESRDSASQSSCHEGKPITPAATKGFRDQPGSSVSSSMIRWLTITRPKIRNGTDRKAPTGPHSQVQNARLRNTASGFNVRRRPTMLGVTKWPSIVVSPTNSNGATAAWAIDGKPTKPTANRISTTKAGPI